MPLYEYVCDQDGTVVEVIRPMAEADKPLLDPENRGRTFKRKLSTFAAVGSSPSGAGSTPMSGGCCPCGKNRGSCGSA
jgi:putative FmdB family regulatory protein